MRKLGDLLNRLIIAAVALAAVALLLVGRAGVNRAYDYREMTAPKSLHQLSQEVRGGADEPDRTGQALVIGAGYFAIVVVGIGAYVFAQNSGRRSRRRRSRGRGPRVVAPQRPDEFPTAPVMRVMPRVPDYPQQITDGRHENDTR